MSSSNFMDQDPIRIQELTLMKRLVTGLLIIVVTIYAVSAYFELSYHWVGYLTATSKAAMVGAIADWFAVTALFRHPLGLRIPHSAIIPNRKDDIAKQFGQFVQKNFQSEDVITEKIARRTIAARWLAGSSSQRMPQRSPTR